ncbi:MAG: methyltransferase domain-containing protein [Chitinivibrionales bacterium]|nr:methyltransferase domain-containing protein [Chitinivibrionales bacterium]
MALFKNSRSNILLSPLFKARSFFYKGNTVNCPCCNGNFKKFLPAGQNENRRENAKCPDCSSLERHRLTAYLSKKLLIGRSQIRFLHIAAEQCLISFFGNMNPQLYVTGELEGRNCTINFSIESIPFKDETFDVALCSHVLEHVLQDRLAITEFYRVLNKNGIAFLEVPVDKSIRCTIEGSPSMSREERIRILKQEDHQRLYGLDFSSRLTEAGFAVEEIDVAREFSHEDIKKYGFDIEEIFFVCRKHKSSC